MVKRADKPIRLYVLAVFVVIGYGLLPLVSVFPFSGGFLLVGPRILPYNGSIQVLYDANGEAPFLLILITLFLGVFSGFSAIAAATGIRDGRTATLLFVTLDVLWWYILVIMSIVASDEPKRILIEGFGQLVFAPFFLAAVWWNYIRPEIGEYYRCLDNAQT